MANSRLVHETYPGPAGAYVLPAGGADTGPAPSAVVVVDANGLLPGDAGYTGVASASGPPGTGGALGQPIPGSAWALTSAPGVNLQASVTKAAGAAGVRNVLTTLSAFLTTSSGLVSELDLTVLVFDGATVIWVARVSVPTSAAQNVPITPSGLFLVGSPATAMVVQFSGAGGSTVFESLNAQGYQAQ